MSSDKSVDIDYKVILIDYKSLLIKILSLTLIKSLLFDTNASQVPDIVLI